MKSESKKYMFSKEVGHSFSVDGFVTWGENYPLQKTMVNHDQQRIVAKRGQEVSNQINRQLLKWAGTRGGDGGKCRDGWVGIDLHLLAEGATRDEAMNKGGHTWPPIVPRQERIGAKEPPVTRGEG